MRKIVLRALAAALIAGSATPIVATQVLAAQPQQPAHHTVRHAAPAAASDRLRDAHNAVTPPRDSVWPYSGWSAPAGR